ncbi:hypothetical protein CK203_048719 [Vitis vinifera]|uniref:Bulb-type lectin domain-containing protein n=1 Tax=Vitis vinifera TaxID=29760 RepID=A0A438GDT9_VITVI|nr:hypothetical protein CK203_048719 [Vitis vinifera]
MFFYCFHTVVSNFPRRYIEREISGKETLTHRSLGLRFSWQFVDAFTDTILQGQSFTTSQTIISAGANRDYSFTNPSVVLTVSTDGNLEILEGKFSYKVTSISPNSNTSATLLDSGNLVLRNGSSDIL